MTQNRMEGTKGQLILHVISQSYLLKEQHKYTPLTEYNMHYIILSTGHKYFLSFT